MSGFITDHVAECCVCSANVDTREVTEGGDPEGCQLFDGQWVCSDDCYDTIYSTEGELANADD